jgi:hypothetical protein
MKKLPDRRATVPQLRYHAETVLGLEVPTRRQSGQLKAKIEAASPGTTEITVEDTVESPAQVQAEKNTAAATAAALKERSEQAEWPRRASTA